MKKSAIVLTTLTALVIVSCQKEIDWGLGGDQQLMKIRSQTGTDSTVISYTYDAQGRLIRENTVGVSGGTTLDNDLTINRNSSEVITTTVQKSAALIAGGIDSILTRYYYNTTNSRYTASAFDISLGGFSITDSAIFIYDNNGRVASDTHYIVSSLIPAFQALADQYTYSGNGLDLVTVAQLAAANPGDPLSPVSTQTYTFDSKVNPIKFKDEGVILGRTGFFDANNPSQLVLDNAADPSTNFTMDYTYKYNLAGKPDSSYGTRTPGATVTASKYFYQ